MKTVRLNHTNSNQLLPIISAANDADTSSPYHATSMNSSKNGSPKSLTQHNANNRESSSSPSPSNGSPTKIATQQSPKTTQSANSPNTAATTSSTSNGAVNTSNTNGSTGLVRRLSVTARPGDIFYKVKDVTESSSTTDTITLDQTEGESASVVDQQNDEHEQEIIIKSSTTENGENTHLMEPNSPRSIHNVSPKSETSSSSTLGRKTTTWNVRRNQTTSLGITSATNSPMTEKKKTATSKDDTSIECLNSVTNNASSSTSQPNVNTTTTNTMTTTNSSPLGAAAAAVEPGSPNFTKELLSIR